MDDVIVIGAGPAGLLAAYIAGRRGARVRVLASGIGTTHVMPGWLGVLHTSGAARSLPGALEGWTATHPEHPYALAGLDALHQGIAALREVCEPAGINYVGDLRTNLNLPTALGATIQAALAPESFAAGNLITPGEILIAGPEGWRDFYPRLCAENLDRQGFSARGVTFPMPEIKTGRFDVTPVGLARLFEQPPIRERVAGYLRARLGGATRVGLPAVIGLERHSEAWHDLQDRLGVPVFELATLPPSVPGMRLFNAFKQALARVSIPLLLDMTVARGVVEGNRAGGVVVPNPSREAIYRAGTVILATGGLYGGGITTDHRGEMREAIFGLPLNVPGDPGDWFEATFLSHDSPNRVSFPAGRPHAIHLAGVRVSASMQPVDETGRVIMENVRVAGRLLAGYDPLGEGSAEGVWLATAHRAAS